MAVSAEVLEKFDRVQERLKQGERKGKALEAEGLGSSTYFYIRNKKRGSLTRGSKKNPFLDIPLVQPATQNITIVICQPSQLKDVLAGLQ